MTINSLREEETPRIQSLARADQILSAVMNHNEAMPLSALTDSLGLNKTTVYNLAESLVVLGFLSRSSSPKGYILGLRCLELGRKVIKDLPILEISRPALREMCQVTGETVNLAVPYLQEAILVEALQSQQGVRATAYAGAKSDYHSSACGKALLANFSEERREWFFNNISLVKHTEHTITDRTLLENELEAVRTNGYSVENQENELGASCVAVPIFGPFGEAIASISVTGVIHRMTDAKVKDIVKRLKQHSSEISEKLNSL